MGILPTYEQNAYLWSKTPVTWFMFKVVLKYYLNNWNSVQTNTWLLCQIISWVISINHTSELFCVMRMILDKHLNIILKCIAWLMFKNWKCTVLLTNIYNRIQIMIILNYCIFAVHDDVIKWKLFLRYWPFVRGIHRSSVNSPHKGQWRGALMFSLICVCMKGWVNNGEAGNLRRYLAHYDVIVMTYFVITHGICRMGLLGDQD